MKDYICIDAKNIDIKIKNIPIENEIYTLRKVTDTPLGKAFLLNEIVNDEIPGINNVMFEPRFHARRFILLEDYLKSIELEETQFKTN